MNTYSITVTIIALLFLVISVKMFWKWEAAESRADFYNRQASQQEGRFDGAIDASFKNNQQLAKWLQEVIAEKQHLERVLARKNRRLARVEPAYHQLKVTVQRHERALNAKQPLSKQLEDTGF